MAEETINEPQYSRPGRLRGSDPRNRPASRRPRAHARTRDGGGAGPRDRPARRRRRASSQIEVEREAHRRTCGPTGSAGRSARSAGRASSPPRPRPRARSPRASWTHSPPASRRPAAARGAAPSRRRGRRPARSLTAAPRLRPQALGEVGDRHAALVALAVAAHGDRALLGLAVADDEHVRDLLQLGLADLAPDGLRAVVELGAQAGLAQPRGDAPAPRRCGGRRSAATIACTGASQTGNSPA